MADFVAVIRRAVDGLSENTPEMRARVYEKARGAVLRQLENMKPRPPEMMFQRQLDKLDDAVRLVEQEHSEALPAEEAAPAPVEAANAEPAPSEPAPAEPVVASAPERIEPEAEHVAPAESEQADTWQDEAAAHEPPPAAPWESRAAEPEQDEAPPVYEQPVAEPEPDRFPVQHDVAAFEHPVDPEPETWQAPELVVAQPTVESPARAEEQSATSFWDEIVGNEADRAAAEARREQVRPVETQPVPVPPAIPVLPEPPLSAAIVQHTQAARPFTPEAPHWAVEVDEEPQNPVEEPVVPADEPPASMPKVSYDETDVVSGFNDFLKTELSRAPTPPPKKANQDFSWDSPFDDLPDLPKPVAFEEALEAKQKEIATDPQSDRQKRKRARANGNGNAKAELEDLIGYAAQPASGENGLPPDVKKAVSRLEGKSFKVQKKKPKSGITPLALAVGIVGVLVLGGGAFAAWQFSDDIKTFIAGMMPADTAKVPDAKPVDAANTEKTVAKTEDTAEKPAEKSTEVAALDTKAGPDKFTQRLMPDGSETAPDNKVSVDNALPEGKTVAGQTELAQASQAETTTKPADDKTAPAADNQPIGVSQKMFLYEERLGQSSPVAVMGTVTWREKNEVPADKGKPEPAVVAQLDVPGRKIKVLVTFNRNTDPSLPASHFIEVVFDLPKDFEEGNIENVQRIAFKQTEQDRGNALIGVPVKVTDDFHMLALNDDAAAIKTNLELMKSRGWIDIPITYRNGRRALITIEKGASGTSVFDKVLGEWAALGDTKSN